ncbi:hypothetical protein BBK82_03735 [Lentzea guizhouensis]|uniref:Uncharacterized protein n=1 Tax=Lentzea guizhouensis TaxID=1586287 RepID=A0A1B2HC81_9PSEU|nr:hypothetical protein [Lentzea guizhouensis]ANZ35328.1 hypothetical protein BBK82_03735 [Lentzea guizhouensis]
MAADTTTTYHSLLHRLLGTVPAVIFRRGSTPNGEVGIVQHTNNIVTISRTASAPEFASALMRATVSLHRGAAHASDPVREATTIRETAARLAVHPVLPLLDAGVEPETLARALGVDLETVLLGIRLAIADRDDQIWG